MNTIFWVAVELAGFGLILAFLWFVWPPLVLVGLGVLMVTWANIRGVRAASNPGRPGATVQVQPRGPGA